MIWLRNSSPKNKNSVNIYLLYIRLAQKHGASNIKVMGSIPRESMN